MIFEILSQKYAKFVMLNYFFLFRKFRKNMKKIKVEKIDMNFEKIDQNFSILFTIDVNFLKIFL